MRPEALFDLSHSLAGEALSRVGNPWELLPDLKALILSLGESLDPSLYDSPEAGIWIARSARIAPTASISAPAIIGENTELRPGAFIRGSVLVGNGAVVGNSCELKNCILFDGVQVPHFNYVGDSILGYKAHLGAGAVTSNVKSDKKNVVIHDGKTAIETGLRKLGAMVGDLVEVGCNSVLCPGSVIGRNTTVYPLSLIRTVVPENSIVKRDGKFYPKEERN